MDLIEKSPNEGDNNGGSPWALISICPVALQRKLGHSTSDRGHQALRYRYKYILTYCIIFTMAIVIKYKLLRADHPGHRFQSLQKHFSSR